MKDKSTNFFICTMLFVLFIIGTLSIVLEDKNMTTFAPSYAAVPTVTPTYTVKKAVDEEITGVKLLNNYDGDTLVVNLPGLPDIFGHNLRVRLAHIDAPELTSTGTCEKKLSIISKEFVTKSLAEAKSISLVGAKRDKFFRIVASVKLTYSDGAEADLSDMVLKNNLAVPYEGEAKEKTDWCKLLKLNSKK